MRAGFIDLVARNLRPGNIRIPLFSIILEICDSISPVISRFMAISVGYRTGNHYRLSEYTGLLIIDHTIENYIHLQKTVISIKQTCYMCTWPCFSPFEDVEYLAFFVLYVLLLGIFVLLNEAFTAF